jgi:hypothetical protein
MHNLGMRPFALNLPEDLVVRLDSVAAAADRSRSFVARSLLERALAQTHTGAPMSDQPTDYEQLRRDQLAEAARAIAARIAPKATETTKDEPL